MSSPFNKVNYFIKKSGILILLLNILIMASMLGAIDSLAENLLGIKKEIPLFSIAILLLSTFVCLSGYDKLARLNTLIVPILLLIFFLAILIISNGGERIANSSNNNLLSCFLYSGLNVFLVQPFLIKIKEEKQAYSPLGAALFSSFILVLAIFLFLGILSEDCIYCDIPLILLVNNNQYLYYLIVTIIFIAIFTTLTAVQFPFCGIVGKDSFSSLILNSVIAFAISRIGFYGIVDKIYPKIAIIAIVYYMVIIAIWLFFVLKERRLHTLNRLKRKGLQC